MGWKEISQRIGELFKLPRGYAFGSNGKWVRVHEPLDSDRLAYFYESGIPVCAAMRRPAGEELYSRLHDFAVFDVDSEESGDAKKAAGLVCNALSASSIPYLCTFSGKKGFHIFVFFTEPADCGIVESWQKAFMYKYGISEKKTAEFPANVDTQLSLGTGKGKIIKLPFSAHPSVEGAYDTPISDPSEFSSIGQTELDWAEKLLNDVTAWSIPKKYEKFAPPPKPTKVGRRAVKTVVKNDADSQKYIMSLIETTPCLKYAYDRLKSGIKGGFWERVAICTTLAQCGVSKEEAERFFLENINDEEDNSTGKLSYYVNYCYEKKSWSSCSIFQDASSHTPICQRPCGRAAPSHDSAILIDYSSEKPIVVCSKCNAKSKRSVFKERGGLREVTWSCDACKTVEHDTPISQGDRDEFYRFYTTLIGNPDMTMCRRRLRSIGLQAYRSMPEWRRLEALQCIKCEAWVGEQCITDDDIRGADIYSRVEIDMSRGKKK